MPILSAMPAAFKWDAKNASIPVILSTVKGNSINIL
jgi:hypothetical protein